MGFDLKPKVDLYIRADFFVYQYKEYNKKNIANKKSPSSKERLSILLAVCLFFFFLFEFRVTLLKLINASCGVNKLHNSSKERVRSV